MELTGEELLRASFLNVLAARLPNGRLQIGEKTFERWPESFEVAGVTFVLTEVEDDAMGIYFTKERRQAN
jgi:hypothetical protein